ncbi:MAG: hypothetical protein A2X94_12060 [Bdellovibrionales bacterium GWB1_55_8]|nr:MAG: hypothetical protein A2X94_12060 [Bdellovibrionales bacterium GWB1_55_8]
MTSKPRYKELHDANYQKMKTAGVTGWGGDQVPDREKRWLEFWQRKHDHPDFPKNGKVLELGSGAGNISPIIQNFGYHITGLEISPTAVEMARDRNKGNPNIQHFEGSILDLSRFQDQAFDIVFDGLCVHCIIGEDRNNVFQEVLRVLKPRGHFLLNSICNDPRSPEVLNTFDFKTRCASLDGIPYRYIPKSDDLLAEAVRHGFNLVESTLIPMFDGDTIEIWLRNLN